MNSWKMRRVYLSFLAGIFLLVVANTAICAQSPATNREELLEKLISLHTIEIELKFRERLGLCGAINAEPDCHKRDEFEILWTLKKVKVLSEALAFLKYANLVPDKSEQAWARYERLVDAYKANDLDFPTREPWTGWKK